MLRVSELFYGLQGEGPSIGTPSVFVRLTGCNLQCSWCDTLDVWKRGENYELEDLQIAICEIASASSLREPFSFDKSDMQVDISDYAKGLQALDKGAVHVVITGGEPLLQDVEVEKLIKAIRAEAPGAYFELETNGTLASPVIELFSQINCSPKLASAREPLHKRCNPSALMLLNKHPNINYKFVIGQPSDWHDVQEDYDRYIDLSGTNIYLMPAALNREELIANSRMVWNLAAQNGLKMTTRLQTIAWSNLKGK